MATLRNEPMQDNYDAYNEAHSTVQLLNKNALKHASKITDSDAEYILVEYTEAANNWTFDLEFKVSW